MNVHRFKLPTASEWPLSPKWPFAAGQDILKVVREFKLQLIDAQNCTALMAASLVKSEVRSLPVVFTLHDVASKWLPISSKMQMRFFLNYQPWSALIAPSRYVANDVTALGHNGQRPVYVVYNGVDTQMFAPAPKNITIRKRFGIRNDDLLLLCPSRIAFHKGIDDLLKAIPTIERFSPKVKVLVSGDGSATDEREISYRNRLDSIITKLRLAERVVFGEGQLPYAQMPLLYSAADIVILPSSISEGFGLGLIEAMSCGVPVIATGVGGMLEVIEAGNTGLLVEPKKPRSIARAVANLVANPELAAKFSKAGREMVTTRFTAREMARQVFQVYRYALSINR
jgi:glycosyltransferase involved in cell wall biosynthesis